MISIKSFKKIISASITVLLLLIAIFLVGIRLFGYTPYSIASSSMSPTYKKGDLVYTKPIKLNDLKRGDTIAFIASEEKLLITHRVIDIDEENKLIYTKGDSNSKADTNAVKYEDILGKVEFKIPFIGHVSRFFTSKYGKYVFLTLVAILLVLLFLPTKKGINNE